MVDTKKELIASIVDDKDYMGKRIERLENSIESFKTDHNDEHKHLTLYSSRRFFEHLFDVLEQQRNLLILLDHRIDELSKEA